MNLDDTFLARTDLLASTMRVNVEDLTEILGVSRSSLFGWRKGRRTVSSKAWRKLELAEREAGIDSLAESEEANDEPDSEEADQVLEIRLQAMEKKMDEMMPILKEVRSLLSSREELVVSGANYRIKGDITGLVSEGIAKRSRAGIIEDEDE